MGLRIGVDTGGTFTDLIGVDQASGALVVGKRPSTPRRPVRAILDALDGVGDGAAGVESLIVGTTVATNAVIQRQGATVIFITTAGFEDSLFIQRMNRKYHYSLAWTKPVPLVERRNCFGLGERMDARGEVVVPLDEGGLRRIGDAIARHQQAHPADDLAVAVCLLFAYLNPAHERRVGTYLRQRFPEVPVSLSHEVAPIWREYERGNTVAADGYVKPLLGRYVASLDHALTEAALAGPWSLMKSNGGSTTPAGARNQPVGLLLSGLAGGILGGQYFGQRAGASEMITLDMGGTSCDVGVIRGGEIAYATSSEIEWGLPVAVPTIDLTTIGAGGGSIAWIDKGGLLRVGPQSAGAEPGPVCYDAGGEAATVTDANLVLGRLDADYFLGGRIALNVDRARAALAALGQRLSLDAVGAAQAVIDIANENMANAIRVLSIDRGLDPREFTLVAFGGAGPLHAAGIAEKVGITRIVIPPYPGLCSAFGALIADRKVNRVRSTHLRSDTVRAEQIDGQLAEMVAEAVAELRAEGHRGEPIVERILSMRYWGQNYEQDITLPAGAVTAASLAEMLGRFQAQHAEFYGYAIEGEVIEIIRCQVTAIGPLARPALPELASGPRPAPRLRRPAVLGIREVRDCPVYRREDLPAGCRLTGPLIVEEVVSTLVVHPGQRLQVDGIGIISLDGSVTTEGDHGR